MIAELIEIAEGRDDCVVAPPRGVPQVRSELVLPDDVAAFYERCGGLWFESWPLAVVGPERFIPTDLAVVDSPSHDRLTAGCYVAAEEDDRVAVVRVGIDLNPARVGRCYDIFWDQYGQPGVMPVIARSFTEFLQLLLAFAGDYDGSMLGYWLATDFEPYGDAYDDFDE